MRLGDAGFWRPYVEEVLARHDLPAPRATPTPGFNPTYPTFLVDDRVVKLFGGLPAARECHAGERAALAAVGADPALAAPRLLAEGVLFEGREDDWPYLVQTRVSGLAWREAALPPASRRSVAASLGEQVRRLHALSPPAALPRDRGPAADVAAAAARSSLPPHLVAQVDTFLARLAPFDPVFVHGDLTAAHVFVDGGRLVGIIDWGDARASDRHYELIQPYRDLFDSDTDLFHRFLEACDWPIGPSFAERSLGLALQRQAIGLAQHHSMDVFEPIAARLRLDETATLEELAGVLFGA